MGIICGVSTVAHINTMWMLARAPGKVMQRELGILNQLKMTSLRISDMVDKSINKVFFRECHTGDLVCSWRLGKTISVVPRKDDLLEFPGMYPEVWKVVEVRHIFGTTDGEAIIDITATKIYRDYK